MGPPVTTLAAADPAPPADPASWNGPRRPAWRVVRAVLALGWLLLAAAILLTGERSASMDSLLAAAASGDTHEVRVSGSPFGPVSRGFEVVQVRWADGPLHYDTQVVEAHPRRAGLRAGRRLGTDTVVTRDVGAYLAARTDGLRVTRGGPTTPSDGIGPWQVPSWVVLAALALWVATLFLLVNGPRPWRATRWAWFWLLFLAAPVGVPAFLVLSGPVAGLRGPRRSRLLTGGWAFLLAVVVGRLLASD